ncbi:EamA family transporter [Chromobacterium haemolyticum]|uniref:EamA family transporter n=1 Tax=Chromobacterium TaxID=535 RepID=UPI0040560AC6
MALFAWLLAGERLQRHKLPGYALIGAGLALSALPLFSGAGGDSWKGDLLLLLASVSWAAFGVLARRWAYPAWPLTRAITIMAALIYLPVYLLWLPKHLAAASWPTLLFQAAYQGGAAAIVAMLLYLRAITALGAVRVGMLFALIPVLAGLLAAPLLNEPLTGYLAAGLACVSLGAWLAARQPATVAEAVPAACGAC